MEAALGRASGCLKEIAGPSRGTGWGSGGQSQMGENLGHHRGIFDGGDDRHGAATRGEEGNYMKPSQAEGAAPRGHY